MEGLLEEDNEVEGLGEVGLTENEDKEEDTELEEELETIWLEVEDALIEEVEVGFTPEDELGIT